MTQVVDASVVVAALIDTGAEGRWAERRVREGGLVAPHLMPAQVGNILRRAALSGAIGTDTATMACADLLRLPVDLLDLLAYAPAGERVWDLRASVTAYDAWYVSIAEALDAPLVTLDRRLSRAQGPECVFVTPP